MPPDARTPKGVSFSKALVLQNRWHIHHLKNVWGWKLYLQGPLNMADDADELGEVRVFFSWSVALWWDAFYVLYINLGKRKENLIPWKNDGNPPQVIYFCLLKFEGFSRIWYHRFSGWWWDIITQCAQRLKHLRQKGLGCWFVEAFAPSSKQTWIYVWMASLVDFWLFHLDFRLFHSRVPWRKNSWVGLLLFIFLQTPEIPNFFRPIQTNHKSR